MRADQPSSEDLGAITSHRIFVPALLWAAALAAACTIALLEPPLSQDQSALAAPAPAPAPAAASGKPGGA